MVTTEFGSNVCFTIKCDCCGRETLGQIKDDKLVIMDRRHGKKHIAIITLSEILGHMKGLVTKS